MNWNKHSDLIGSHAFLSASKYHWINYDDARLEEAFKHFNATERGTKLHEFAATCIELGQPLPRSNKTLNMYVNDAIRYQMKPEQVLYFSDNCFGTADAICYRDNLLRIHDLKTGEIPAHIEQLLIYSALFCLEYAVKPVGLDVELRIYQNNEILHHEPEPDEIQAVIDKIVNFNKLINKLKMREELS